MSLGTKTRGPRVSTKLKIKIFFAVLKAMAENGPALVSKGATTVSLYKQALQGAVNAAAKAEKPPRNPTKTDDTGATVNAFPVEDATAKQSIVTLLEKYANDKRHVDGAKNVDWAGNVKVYTEGEGDKLHTFYLDKNDKGELVRVALPDTATEAQFPKEITDQTISGFVPGERVKQNIDDMFSDAAAAEFDIDNLLSQYGVETETEEK